MTEIGFIGVPGEDKTLNPLQEWQNCWKNRRANAHIAGNTSQAATREK